MKPDRAEPVYLDVDTGADDALAIMLAVLHPALDVRGITTVVGNVDLTQVTRNTLQVLDLLGANDVPVASGAARPIVAPARSAALVHGEDGLGNVRLPAPTRRPLDMDAVAFLREELLAAPEPVTLIGLAPLTNLALLFQSAPEVKSKIRKLALMGGAVEVGNATAVAEFNIYHDPEAAEIVFSAGVPILMYGLDVFRRVTFRQEEVDRYFASREMLAAKPHPGSAAELAGHLFHFFISNFGRPAISIGDAGCVASVIDPAGLTTEWLPVYVETGGRHCRGQTVVDRRPKDMVDRYAPTSGTPYSEVILDINEEFYRQIFRQTVGQLEEAGSMKEHDYV